MMDEMKVVVKGGQIRCIYSDDLAPLMGQGHAVTRRASHVEPCDGGWQADLSPVEGPVLGPFGLRSTALTEEVNWLRDHNIPIPKG